jgi:hypothetical protein
MATLQKIILRYDTGDIDVPVGPEFGVNGLTHEALLAIIMDRLRCFQAGPYASDAPKQALFHCECALDWLQKLTRDRLARGVEGTAAR